jgi:hypothetical protein
MNSFLEKEEITPRLGGSTDMLLIYGKSFSSSENGLGWVVTFQFVKWIVGRLVVVIDVNPSHGFWTTRLMKLFGHEGK